MTVAGKTYTGGWDAEKYTLTAKFEQNIEDLWPTASNFNSGSKFSGWSINGVRGVSTSKRVTMTADLCASGGKTATANYDAYCLDHLYYMFESFDQTSPVNGNDRKSYNGKYYDKSTVYSQDVNSEGNTRNQKSITGMTAKGTDTKVLQSSGGLFGYATERNVFLYYDRLSYKLTWNNYGSTTTDTLKYGAPLTNKGAPARPSGFSKNATFKGWYTVPVAQITNTTVPFDFTGKTMPASNMTLFAYWVEAQIKVTFIVGDKSFEASIPYGTKAASADAYATAITAISTSGKTLLKWVDNTTGSAVDVNQQLYTNTTLRAVFKGDTHKVTYVVTPGTGSVTDDRSYEYDALAVVKSGSGITLPAGKVFLGWTTVAGGTTVTKYPGSTVQMKDQDITLYAVYGDKASTVQLTYKANGGNGADITDAKIPNNKQVTLRDENTFTRTDYHFTGWNTEANGTGTSFSAGASARVDNLGSGNVLYAQWAPNTNTKYTVEFYYQDGDSYRRDHSDPRTGTTDTTVSVTDTDKADKENGKYTFDANNANNILSGPVAADGSLVLKLYFKLNQADVTVNYYWNETTDKVATSKPLSAQTVGSVITTETPITIEGYTALPNQTCSLTVGVDASKNVINFYYYKNVELTAVSDSKVYNGSEQTISGYTADIDGVNFDGISASGSGTDVDEYDVTFEETPVGKVDTTNKYIVTKANNGQLTITANATAIVVKIKGNTLTKTYDGKEHSVTGYDVTITGGNNQYTTNDFSFTGTAEAKGTNVKTDGYSMGLTAAQFTNTSENFSNVKFEVTDGKLTINPRTVTLTSGSASKQYDGTPLTKDEVKVTGDGFADGEGATYDVTGAITNVADNKPNNNTFTYTLSEGTTAGNYVIEIMYGTLKITPVAAEVTVEIKGHTTDAIYDATEKTAEGYDVISISNELYTANDFALTGKDKVTGTAAGQYDMNLAFKNISENFSKVTFVVEDGKLTIAKRDVTVTGESATKVYNGQTQEINGYTVDNLVKGHEMTGVIYSAKGKDPGKYDGSFTGSQIVIKDAAGTDVFANYNVKPVIGVLTITQPSHPTRPSTPTKDVTSVKTADGSQMTLWMSMMLASAAGIVFLGKKRKEEQ